MSCFRIVQAGVQHGRVACGADKALRYTSAMIRKHFDEVLSVDEGVVTNAGGLPLVLDHFDVALRSGVWTPCASFFSTWRMLRKGTTKIRRQPCFQGGCS